VQRGPIHVYQIYQNTPDDFQFSEDINTCQLNLTIISGIKQLSHAKDGGTCKWQRRSLNEEKTVESPVSC
jgi:hypothetical protein